MSTQNISAYAQKLASGKFALAVCSEVKLNGKKVRSNANGITGQDAGSRTTWIDVGPKGEWAGHSDGPFVLDDETFDSVIKSFKKRKSAPQVDYGHGSLYETDGLPKPAAGYILDLAVENGRLWAKVEFTKKAAAFIKNGEYRYCSGVFVWNVPDPETGEEVFCVLDSIGLTNRPFIDGQNPIMLSLNPNKQKDDSTKRKLNMTAKEEKLEEKKDAKEAELACKPKALAEMPEEEVKKEEEMSGEEFPPAAVLAEDPLSKLAEMFSMDVSTLLSKLMEKADAVKALFEDKKEEMVEEESEMAEEMAEGEVGDMESEELPASTIAALSQIKSLSMEIAKLKKSQVKSTELTVEDEVEKLINEGKLLPSAKADMVSLATKDIKSFRALSRALPVIVPMGKDAPAAPAKLSISESPDEISETHPKYVALSNYYRDPKNGWSEIVKSNKVLDRFIRDVLKRNQSFGV